MITVYFIANVWDKDVLEIDDAIEFQTDRDIRSYAREGYDRLEVQWLIQDISEFYFYRYDGWEIEKTWRDGVTIALWDDERNFVGKFDSQLEYEPSFCVTPVKE